MIIKKITIALLTFFALFAVQATGKGYIPSKSHQVVYTELGNTGMDWQPPVGNCKEIADFDLNKKDAKFMYFMKGMSMQFVKDKPFNYYRLKLPSNFRVPRFCSMNKICMKLNRDYLLTVVLRTDFNRPLEVNLGVFTNDRPQGLTAPVMVNFDGIPNKTKSWIRWNYRFTSFQAKQISRIYRDKDNVLKLLSKDSNIWGCFYAFIHPLPALLKDPSVLNLEIAQVKIFELPPVKMRKFKKGEGVTFRGGPASLPMSVDNVEESHGKIRVATTGALYEFDTSKNLIKAFQSIGLKREMMQILSNVSLKDLKVDIKNDRECVLSNDNMTIGIQCDSMMVVSPQKNNKFTVKPLFKTEYQRFVGGHFYGADSVGGVTVNAHLPMGTGRLARTSKDLGSYNWFVSPGERLAFSVFPPRPYDWEKSFTFNPLLVHENQYLKKKSKEWIEKYSLVPLLWSFNIRSWGMSFAEEIVPKDEEAFVKLISSLKETNCPVIEYFSPYFYINHDPEKFIEQATKHLKKYNLDGYYYDGVYSQDFLAAYELMRMSREMVGDGVIYVHTTGQPDNGGPPLARPDLFIPAIDTYATATLRGEKAPLPDKKALGGYMKYISSQYMRANCIGFTKTHGIIDQKLSNWISLFFNGRPRVIGNLHWLPSSTVENLEIINKLKELYNKHGGKKDFYKKYYLPEVFRLLKDKISPSDMEKVKKYFK